MKTKGKSKKLLSFALALVMMFSPIFLSGCFDGFFTSNSIGSNQNQQTQTNPTSGGSTGNGGNSNNQNNNDDENDNRQCLDYEEYPLFFKNYRITYSPKDSINRSSFNEAIDSQNSSIATKIIGALENEYKSETNNVFADEIDCDEIKVQDGSTNYYLIKQPKTNYVSDVNDVTVEYFSHQNAISTDVDQFDNVGWVSKNEDGGIKNTFANNIKLAELIILAGYQLNEDGTGEFDNEYNSHLDANRNVRNDDLTEIYKKIDHLGFTQSEMMQVQYFILNYVIGKNLVDLDNTRFVNAYYDGGVARVVKNNTYNRFLTDETYAMAFEETSLSYSDGSLLEFDTIEDSSVSNRDKINSTIGLCEYVVSNLGYASLQGFELSTDPYDGTRYFDVNMDYDFSTKNSGIGEGDKHSTTDGEYLNSGLKQAFSSIIYQNLIKTNYRDTGFNANFWDIDEDGNLLSGSGNSTVFANIGGIQRTLFSVKLPYFKNYFNTTYKIVNEIIFGKATDQTKQDWLMSHTSEYPYKNEYPTVPFTLFADYTNGDMLFDGKSGCAKMFSGYQHYQSMVLMPKQAVEVEDGALFITRELAEDEAYHEDGTTDGFGDFEMTVYVRYYDSTTQSFAMWEGEDGTFSEFYVLSTLTIKYEAFPENLNEPDEDDESDDDLEDDEEDDLDEAEDNDEDFEDDETGDDNQFGSNFTNITPNVVDFSVKDILKSAYNGGVQNETYLLDGFAEDSVLSKHKSTLVTKEKYGYLFNYVDTPDGKQVVCFDGKGAGAPSYIELIFSCPENAKFQFCFYPTVAYDPAVE